MPDYMFLLESRLSPEQRAVMLRVQELAAAMGFNLYLTGGTVRDLITGASLRDLDFTVEGNPSKIARELEKGGAKILVEDEKLRHIEVLFAGDVEGSISAARDDHYVRPGTRPEIRWSTIMEDLRRRDFSLNSIAISLNPASRGLLLDPTNGLSDIERGEVRALDDSQLYEPAGALAAAFCGLRRAWDSSRRGARRNGLTWRSSAICITPSRRRTPEGNCGRWRARSGPAVVLKAWEQHDLLEVVNPNLAKRHPDYDAIARLMKVREDLFTAGFRPRLGRADVAGDSGKAQGSRAERRAFQGRVSFGGNRQGAGFRGGGLGGAEGIDREENECADRCLPLPGADAAGSDCVFAGRIDELGGAVEDPGVFEQVAAGSHRFADGGE